MPVKCAIQCKCNVYISYLHGNHFFLPFVSSVYIHFHSFHIQHFSLTSPSGRNKCMKSISTLRFVGRMDIKLPTTLPLWITLHYGAEHSESNYSMFTFHHYPSEPKRPKIFHLISSVGPFSWSFGWTLTLWNTWHTFTEIIIIIHTRVTLAYIFKASFSKGKEAEMR